MTGHPPQVMLSDIPNRAPVAIHLNKMQIRDQILSCDIIPTMIEPLSPPPLIPRRLWRDVLVWGVIAVCVGWVVVGNLRNSPRPTNGDEGMPAQNIALKLSARYAVGPSQGCPNTGKPASGDPQPYHLLSVSASGDFRHPDGRPVGTGVRFRDAAA